MNIDDRIRRALHAAEAQCSEHEVPTLAPPRRNWHAVSIGAVLLVGATGLMLARSASEPSEVAVPTTRAADVTTTVADPDRLVEGAVPVVDALEPVDLVDGVAAWNDVMVWTGNELVFWGGEDETSGGVPAGEPGHAFDPASGIWRQMSPSPKSPTYGAAGVWTGDELIICCGARSRATVAYDPNTDEWRMLADSPIGGDYAEAVWTGTEMLVVTIDGAAAYDPQLDTWRTFAPAPAIGRLNAIVWTGSELIVWPANVARATARGVALAPDTGLWRTLAVPPALPAAVDLAWTGTELIVWGGLPAGREAESERAVGSRLNLATGRWSELPEVLPEPDGCECNLGGQTLLWTGDTLLVSTGFFGTGFDPDGPLLLGYDPDADSWTLVGRSPFGWGGEAILAGDRVVFRSDRLYVGPSGWIPTGTPIPTEGLLSRSEPSTN